MYSTCLFCHGQLGHNEALEHFPVGRRLAYDMATGRLWVICGRCQRWNLSPIETRWEALEDAERAFRGTRLRVSTDNIALAQLCEGLELVRIGKPPRLELAGWRYGNMFAKRWRRHAVVAGATTSALAVYMGSQFVPAMVPSLAHLTLAGSASALLFQGAFHRYMWRDARNVRFHVRDDDGHLLGLSAANARATNLLSIESDNDWRLEVPYRTSSGKADSDEPTGSSTLHGETALRAAGTVLPYLNRSGAREEQVREALNVLDSTSDIRTMFTGVIRKPKWRSGGYKLIEPITYIGSLPPRHRLAMEMALHDVTERHALEGELAELHERWKEAEEIGKIADGLV